MQKYNQCIRIDPVKSSTFHQYYQHIVSTCPKIVHPTASNKKWFLPQTTVPNVSTVISPDLVFDAPFPSRDVDGGDISKFSSASNFLSYTHSTTMKDHETDDTGLHNDDICGNVGMNVIEANVIEDDDLKVCTAKEQQIFGDKAFGCEIIYNGEIESNQLADFDSKSIDSSHDGQSRNKSIDATAWSVHHSAIPDSTTHHGIEIPNTGTTTACDGNENSDPAYITTTRDGNENFDPAYTTTRDGDENSDPAYTTTTCDGNEILLTVPACANCGNDGDTIGRW